MAKRQASLPPEDDSAVASPAPKRARVEDAPETPESADVAHANGNHDNGQHTEPGVAFGEQLEEEEESADLIVPHRQSEPDKGYEDLYLDTIDRKVLDFDFEKLCSVTLTNINVYACLVCGKYYQGRGPKTQAYFHSLDVDHHVFINMDTRKIYVLPEGYEVKSRSLDDIKFVVDPRLPRDEVLRLDTEQKFCWDLNNKQYVPGFVGMNNIKANDYFNVVIQALAHVSPLRNYFMLEDLSNRPQLAQRFSSLVRKIWNPRAFKAHVSPHELLQEIALRSSKRFTLTDQSDPADFMMWFLNNLHTSLGGTEKKRTVVSKVFRGNLKVESQEITKRADLGDRLRFEDAKEVKTQIPAYWLLPLDLPPVPLFQDALEQNIIPQVPLLRLLGKYTPHLAEFSAKLIELLEKYNGIHATEKMKDRVRHRLLHPLPPYLIFHIKRFSRNKFVAERNTTIVTFNPQSLDMAPFVQPDANHSQTEPIYYDLVANITHEAVKRNDDSVEGEQDKKVWRVQLHDRSRDEWWGIQDLYVERERAETLHTKESYLQVWEKRKSPNAN
jgi:U4/U6.U5 tri-snRNP-associated protein 2